MKKQSYPQSESSYSAAAHTTRGDTNASMAAKLRLCLRLFKRSKVVTCGLAICLVFYLANYTLPPDSFYTRLDAPVNSLDFGFPITPEALCKSEGPRLVVLVLSAPGNVQKRNAIRETWGNTTFNSKWPSSEVDIDVKFIFLVGQSSSATSKSNIKLEASVHKDILQVDIPEKFGFNLVKKTVMGFKWIVTSCWGIKHIMKVDDDVFVNIPAITNKLKSPQYNSSICGYMLRNVFTKRFGKYKMTFDEYPYVLISKYVYGYCYVMPTDVARRLVMASLYVPYLSMEDVYITGVLARTEHVKLEAFQYLLWDRELAFQECDFVAGKRDVISELQPNQMRSIWRTIVQPNVCKRAV